MPLYTTDALILRTYKLGESDRVVVFLTRDRGQKLGVAIVEAMAAGVAIDPLARYFEYWLLRLQGVYESGARMSAEARAFLEAARASSPFAIGGVKVSPRALKEIEGAHRELIAMHL